MLKSSTESKILTALPNDRPITAIQIVESLDKCPPGFKAISRTHDQDQDADLRESSIFKISSARYLCVSKTESLGNLVITDILIIAEKLKPPAGFSLLNKTVDSEQRAWRKKQLCYRLVQRKDTNQAVTDIIVCNRLKKAPQGFNLAGYETLIVFQGIVLLPAAACITDLSVIECRQRLQSKFEL